MVVSTIDSKSPEAERRNVGHGSDTEFDALDVASVRRKVKRKFVNEAAFTRLRSEIAAARPEFELLIERVKAERTAAERRRHAQEGDDTDPEQNTQTRPERDTRAQPQEDTRTEVDAWMRHGSDLLDEAKKALVRGAIEDAWRHLHTARRFEVYGLDELDWWTRERNRRSEIETRAAVVREEALDALEGWRRRAVVDLLCDENEALRDGITGSELRTATRVLYEQYESVYLARNERQRQFNQLVVLGALSGLALFVLTLFDVLWVGVDSLWGSSDTGLVSLVGNFFETPFSETVDDNGTMIPDIGLPGFAAYMTVAGVMGAALFGMLSLKKRSISTSIPQQVSQLTVTGARGVIGAISALLFYFALQTSALDGAILADGVLTPSLMVVLGFAAGYTERLAPIVVGKIASITDADEPAAPGPVDGAGAESRERTENWPTTATR